MADLRGLVELLAKADRADTNAVRVDLLEALERVKAAVAATQARVTAAFLAEEQRVAAEWRERVRVTADDDDFDAWRAARDEERRHCWPPEPGRPRSGRAGSRRGDRIGVVAQIALARRVSPSRAAALASTATTLVHEMPATLAALEVGDLSEWRAELLVRECESWTVSTACSSTLS